MHHLVSVIMSVYNGERFLREAVNSILNQTFTDFEFIIVNDGSTDGTKGILESYVDERIALIHQENMGLTKALNNGITLARGKYIARQDADDVSKPERLEKQVTFMEAHPAIGLLGTRFEAIDEHGQVTRLAYLQENNKVLLERLLEINQFSHGSVMLRKEALERVGLFRDFFKYSQDYDLWLRIAEKYEVANLPEFLFCYRELEHAISSKKILAQSLYAGVAREMALQRREAGNDTIQLGEVPTLPSVQRLSKGLHNKLITFYTQNPQEMLDGLQIKTRSHGDLIYLFKKLCADKLQCEAELQKKYEEISQTDQQTRALFAEHHNCLLDSIERKFDQKFNEVLEALNKTHVEALRQKDEMIREKENELHQSREALDSVHVRAENEFKLKHDAIVELSIKYEQAVAARLRLEREVVERDSFIAEKTGLIEQLEMDIREHKEELTAKDRELADLNRMAAEEKLYFENELAKRNGLIAEHNGLIEQLNVESRRQKGELAAKDRKLADLNRMAADEKLRFDGAMAKLNSIIAGKAEIIENLDEQMKNRERDLRQKGDALRSKIDELNAMRAELARLRDENDEEKREFEKLLWEKEQRIGDLLNSKSWKITAPLRKVLGIVQKKVQ